MPFSCLFFSFWVLSFFIISHESTTRFTKDLFISLHPPPKKQLLYENINTSGIFTKYVLYSDIWNHLNTRTDEEIEIILNKIFPVFSEQRSKLFDDEYQKNYNYTYLNNKNEYVFPDPLTYRWISPKTDYKDAKYINNFSFDDDYIDAGPEIEEIIRDHRRVLPKTREFQEWLFKHQNPMMCENKNYVELVVGNWGFGALMKNLARQFMYAVTHDFIPIISPEEWVWAKGDEFCQDDRSYHCYFEEISNCSRYFHQNTHLRKIFIYRHAMYPMSHHIPKWINDFLAGTPIVRSEKTLFYYLQSQFIAYLMRPNKKTTKWMNDFEKNDPLHVDNSFNKIDVTLHIRHGDKGSEMKLVPTLDFVKAIKIIQRLEKRKNLTVFVSTEDQEAIEILRNSTEGLTILAYNMKRINGGYIEFIQNAVEISLTSLLNLRESIKLKYFVGTVKSCWSYMVNLLRLTAGFHHNDFYFEVGEEICLSVYHCKILNEGDNLPETWGIW
ncbi:hypothetical protein TRFO_42465 [Tritrichomonas foetus]|uniref:Uncharacterized protein n=1 Tax=Tritrichomonas foetus TaxID=1144522 RepID=A0A1J4L142_9EUKA|nr:hypothetical protein TRFO_42465 [Tritrichomonas foetus]|eukprot:OHT15597.1 hypothetical protein TRFO_42465 [Tritrichomonas foetus]